MKPLWDRVAERLGIYRHEAKRKFYQECYMNHSLEMTPEQQELERVVYEEFEKEPKEAQ